jgi:hypothetical protein
MRAGLRHMRVFAAEEVSSPYRNAYHVKNVGDFPSICRGLGGMHDIL